MATDDPLNRFGATSQDPPNDDPPDDPEVTGEGAGEVTPQVPSDPQTPQTPPQTQHEAVDEKGVPWKNRAIENKRKLDKATKKIETMEERLARLEAAQNTPPVTTPVVQKPEASQSGLDLEVVRGKSLEEWPDNYLVALKTEDPRYTGRVDAILQERIASKAADAVDRRNEMRERHKTVDREIKKLYPAVTDSESPLRSAMSTVMRQWSITGADIEARPEVLWSIVREAADRIGVTARAQQPATPTEYEGNVNGQTQTPQRKPATKQVKLTAEQQRMQQVFGLNSERFAQEVEATSGEPFLAGVDK